MTIKELGYSCKCWRRGADITQKEMAVIMNKSAESVSAFECGRNDSAMMLMYYIAAGYPIDQFLKEARL